MEEASSPRAQPLIVIGLCLLLVLPFLGKAVHMDDPLFLWSAKQIVGNPTNFYGFPVNWYGFEMQMHEVNQNPPGYAYFLAPVGALFGWAEWTLHLWSMIPALGAGLGVWCLARGLNAGALLSAALALITPVFAVSATMLMVDVLLLCLWVWAIECWRRGIERDRWGWLVTGSVLVGAAALTKYVGLALLPLLVAYTLAMDWRKARYITALVIPVALVAGFMLWSQALYGHTLVLDAAGYSTEVAAGEERNVFERLLVSLAFTGASMAPVVFLAPFLWSRRGLVAWAVGAIVAGVGAYLLYSSGHLAASEKRDLAWWHLAQFGFWCVSGVHVLVLASFESRSLKDPRAVLLVLWVFGVFVFAWLLNWTVSARVLLPMAPAVAIVVARRLESTGGLAVPGKLAVPLAASLALSLWVSFADYRLAATVRDAAGELSALSDTNTVWFSGHWGFQYYMEQRGAKPIDTNAFNTGPDDLVVTAYNNTNVYRVQDARYVRREEEFEFALPPGNATVNFDAGAGFYSDIWGPIPFVIGPVPPIRYTVQWLKLPDQE